MKLSPVNLSQEIYVPPDIDIEGEVFRSFAPEMQEQVLETLRKRKRQVEAEEMKTREFLKESSPPKLPKKSEKSLSPRNESR